MILATSNWIAWMACVLVDTTICVRWTELGEKESPKTRISLKIWKVAAKPKFIENWKNSWKKSRKFMEFKEVERVWTLFNNLTHFSRTNVQILGKEIIYRQYMTSKIFLLWNILCGYLGRILHGSPVFQCIIAALLNYTKLNTKTYIIIVIHCCCHLKENTCSILQGTFKEIMSTWHDLGLTE